VDESILWVRIKSGQRPRLIPIHLGHFFQGSGINLATRSGKSMPTCANPCATRQAVFLEVTRSEASIGYFVLKYGVFSGVGSPCLLN